MQNNNNNKSDNNPVLCIPRMDKNIPKEYIIDKLRKLNFGYIEKIIEIPLKNGTDNKRVLIKIKWNSFPNTINYKKRLNNGESIKLVYDMINAPWFWKIVVSCPQINST
jgi:hypothetical protein